MTGANLRRCVRALIAMVNDNSSSLVRFSNFTKDFRQTNCGVPLKIDRPTMLKWNSRHMTSFAEETGDHLLRSDFIFEDPHVGLLFCFGLIRIDWFTMAMIRHLWITSKQALRYYFANISLHNRHEPFLERLYEIQREQIIFTPFHAILNVCWWKKCPKMPLSHGMSYDYLAVSVHARHQCSPTHAFFWTTFTDLVFWRPSSTVEFIKPVFRIASWCFIAKDLNSSMHPCRDNPRRKL